MNMLYTGAASVRAPQFLPVPPQVGRDADAAIVRGPQESLRFRQLHTPQQISSVLSLRREIRLPEATLNDAGFAALEKKEMRSDLLELSSGMAA